MVTAKVTDAAKVMSSLGASKGGKARAAAMTPAARSEVARGAAAERWGRAAGLPKETHEGVIVFGDISIPCAVLDNGTRVLSAGGISRAFGSGKKSPKKQIEDGAPHPPAFLAAQNLKAHFSADLVARIGSPLTYRAKSGGRVASGYEASLFPDICKALLEARRSGSLHALQQKFAIAAEVFVAALAKVGISALVDEATGYQSDRARDELQRLLETYVVEEMRPWVKLFPNAFFRQVYRLHGWKYEPGHTQGPRYVGKFINLYVYDRLPAPVVEELKRKNPVVGSRRKHRLHQFLTEDIGHPVLDRHLASVTTLMAVASDKDHFKQMFVQAFGKSGEQLALPRALDESE